MNRRQAVFTLYENTAITLVIFLAFQWLSKNVVGKALLSNTQLGYSMVVAIALSLIHLCLRYLTTSRTAKRQKTKLALNEGVTQPYVNNEAPLLEGERFTDNRPAQLGKRQEGGGDGMEGGEGGAKGESGNQGAKQELHTQAEKTEDRDEQKEQLDGGGVGESEGMRYGINRRLKLSEKHLAELRELRERLREIRKKVLFNELQNF